MKTSLRPRIATTLVVLALLGAACGSTNDQAAQAARDSESAEPAILPPNSNPDDTPIAIGACYEDEPDCEDTAVVNEPGTDLPANDSGRSDAGGMLVNGGLTVAEALTTDASGVLGVAGFLFVDDGGARLCELLAESYPAQCGGVSIPIAGHETVSASWSSAQGISWTDQHVSVFGEIINGTLIVNSTVSG